MGTDRLGTGCAAGRRRLALIAVGAAAGGACAATPQPQGPVDVRVTELAPEVVDEVAAGVAERLAALGYVARPARRAPAAPPAASPGRRAAPPATGGVVSQPPATVRRAPPPAAPTPSDSDLARVRESVDLALDWLAKHQSESGAWSCADFASQCKANRCDGGGQATHDVGVTGLSLLCFLGAGNTHTSGPHAQVVERGLRFLKGSQDPEGCVGPRVSQHFLYDHAYGTFALVEAYGMTASPALRDSAQRGVDFIARAQNPYLGWRYGIRDGDNDTSVTGLMTTVLRSAQNAGLAVDPGAFRGALAWFDKMTEPEFGRVGYNTRGGPPARTMEAVQRFPAALSEAPTAVATAARIFAGENPSTHEHLRKGAVLLAATPPVWDREAGSIDLHYWYWGTLALQQCGGREWESWKAHLVRALPSNQRTEEGRDERGSWDPVDAWGAEGGRVYSTAMACLASQIVSRSGRAAR